MKQYIKQTLALGLSVSLLAAYSPLGFAAEHMDISDTQTISGETFSGLSITGSGAAITVTAEGNLTASNIAFTGNSATQYGGALYNAAGAQTVIETSHFTNNDAYKKGGAIYNAGTMEIKDGSSFTGNTTSWDGAAGSGPEDTNSNGGAIWNSGSLTLGNNITFQNNQASYSTSSGNGHGSDIYNYGGNVTIGDNATFTRDELASVHDCSIFSSGGTLTIGDNASFSNVNEAIVTSGTAEVTIGDNLHITDTVNGIASWGKTVTIGKNAVFENIIGDRVFQTVTGGQTFQFGDGLIVKNNINIGANPFGTIYNEKNSTMHFLGSSTFSNNQAPRSNAGVFQNWSALTFDGEATFTGNLANGDAGALRNRGTASEAVFNEDAIFANNKATGNGGAILNEGTLVFNKNVSFSDNIAEGTGDYIEDENGIFYDNETDKFYTFTVINGTPNDIYNTGTLTFNGTANLNGGITGNGSITVNNTLNIGTAQVAADSLAFADNANLGVTVTNEAMGNLQANTLTIGNGAKLQVVLAKDFLTTEQTSYRLVNTGAAVTGSFTLANAENALYNVSLADNMVTAQRKTVEETQEVIEQAGGNSNTTAVVEAFTSSADLGSENANKTADIINQLTQTDLVAAVHAVKALAPQEAPDKQVIHQTATNQVFTAIDNHIQAASAPAARTYALADKEASYKNEKYSVWAQGLLNKTHKEETDSAAFTGRSTGLAGGADIQFTDSWLAGLGYAYVHTNVDSLNRHDRILGDNFFVYGQYKPGRFFVQGSFTYGDSKYEEHKYMPGLTVNADYHVKTYAANATAGYELLEWLTPLVGLRYMNVQQEGYKDSSDQAVAAEQNDYLTGTLGVQLQQAYHWQKIQWIPQVSAALAYDLVSQNAESTVLLPNNTSYNVNGDRLHRLSVELGAALGVLVTEQVEVLVGYTGSLRQDYTSHTGTLKLRYSF